MATYRSLLFTPANRPHRFERAKAAGADAVCLDLEDAVPPCDKAEARSQAAAFLEQAAGRGPAVGVRINARGSNWHVEDLAAVAAFADFIMLPKANTPADVRALAEAAPNRPIWPLIETADGVRHAWDIAAESRVAGVLFGAFDYAADVGCTLAWEPLLYARGRLAAACARARIELLDAPSGDLNDLDALSAGARLSQALGFTGRACIHPDQVRAVNAVFTPTPSEVATAKRVLAAYEAAGEGVAQLDGRLIERPVALAARRVLARAGG